MDPVEAQGGVAMRTEDIAEVLSFVFTESELRTRMENLQQRMDSWESCGARTRVLKAHVQRSLWVMERTIQRLEREAQPETKRVRTEG